MECAICKEIKQPTKDNKNPCFPCDNCRNLICVNCSDLTSSEVKCLPLQKRTLKFHCTKCRNYELFDILQNSMKDKERIIQEQEEIIRLLKDKLHEYESKNTPLNQKSYADVIKESGDGKKINYPEVIIKPRQIQSSTQTRKDIEKDIKPSELKIGIKRFKTTKNGTMVIACQSKQESETLKNAVKQKLGNSYEVDLSKMRKPKIKITNITQDYDKEEMVDLIKQQNTVGGTIKVTYIRNNRNGHKTAFCECSPKAYQDIMKLKKNCIGWERYPVYEDAAIPRCFKCQGFFHKMNRCQNKTVCPICSDEHEEKQCPKENLCCNNCLLSNKKFKTTHAIDHHSHSQDCPSLKYHLDVLINKTDYYSEE